MLQLTGRTLKIGQNFAHDIFNVCKKPLGFDENITEVFRQGSNWQTRFNPAKNTWFVFIYKYRNIL